MSAHSFSLLSSQIFDLEVKGGKVRALCCNIRFFPVPTRPKEIPDGKKGGWNLGSKYIYLTGRCLGLQGGDWKTLCSNFPKLCVHARANTDWECTCARRSAKPFAMAPSFRPAHTEEL